MGSRWNARFGWFGVDASLEGDRITFQLLADDEVFARFRWVHGNCPIPDLLRLRLIDSSGRAERADFVRSYANSSGPELTRYVRYQAEMTPMVPPVYLEVSAGSDVSRRIISSRPPKVLEHTNR